MPPAAPTSTEPGLQDYLSAIWRRKWTVLITAVLAVAVAVALDSVKTKRYTATAQVLLVVPGATTTSGKTGQPDVPTDIQLITSSQVKAQVKKAIGQSPGVTVAQVGATDVVAISNTNIKAARAALVADTYAKEYLAVSKANYLANVQGQIKDLQDQINQEQFTIIGLDQQLSASPNSSTVQAQLTSALSQQTQLKSQLSTLQQQVSTATSGQIVTPAKKPSSPSSPKTTEDILFALGIGLLIGIGIALVRDHLDDRIRSREELEAALPGVSTIGLIPEVTEWRDRKKPFLVSEDRPKSPSAEAYRSLRTAVNFMTLERPIKLLQVTSAAAADGKTATSANLAVAMAQAGQRVVLVACDLRKPRIHEFFGLDNEPGFTSVLAGDAELEDVLFQVPDIENLALVPSGPVPPNPSELLSGSTARTLFARLAASFDIVVIDTSPILPVTDGSILAAFADAVLLVAAADISTQRDVRRAAELLYRVNANLVGSVLNRASQSDAYVYYRYGYGYGYGYGRGSERERNGGRQSARAEVNGKGAHQSNGAVHSQEESGTP